MNYLISPEAGCGHACELAKALSKLIPLTTHYFWSSVYGLDFIHPAKIGYNLPQSGEHLIIMTVYAYDEIVLRYGERYFDRFQKVTIIIPDGRIWYKPEYHIEKFKHFSVFATPCKIEYVPGAREYIQPFDLDQYLVKKMPIACHSPFSWRKTQEKGTEFIVDTFTEIGLKYKLIHDVSWVEAIREKAKCEYFVDQIGYDPKLTDYNTGLQFPANWRGGIGKSGYEAMLLKCLVFSIGKYEGIEIPAPPVVWITKETLKEKLIYHMKHKTNIAEKQYEWAKKYCNPEFQARRILCD